MNRDFNAFCVSVEETADLWLVGFADSQFNTKRYLTLQRGKFPQSPEDSLDPTGYHVELDDQRIAGYEGIKHFVLFTDRVVVEFEDEALAGQRDNSEIVVEFSLRPQQLDQLRNGLTRIFDGYECFADQSA